MARISQKTIDLIKDTADIVDVVGEYVTLQAAGKNMKGLCPFHSEKTPSFFVSKERQIFNCFGCGKKGDAAKFISEYKHINYFEALEFLAEKYHIEMDYDDNQTVRKSNTNLYKANDLALEYFSLNLLNIESGKPALDYLLDRGLTFEIIEEFELGYAPNKFAALFEHLNKEYQALELLNAGLVNRSSEGTYYDLFRSRIIFPIRDEQNRVIAFSGRVFGDSDNPAKYVNTPYTEIFSKGNVLYNLSRALPHARQKQRLVLMEGYMDVIKASMVGVKEAICSMGTQLTLDQALTIKKYTENVVICYDGDKAGREATYKAIKLLENAKLNVKVLSLPDGLDPDEFISKNPDFADYLEDNLIDQYEFVFKMIVDGSNLVTPSEIETVKNKLFDFFSKTSGMIREIYLKRFASTAGQSYQTILSDYRQSRVDEKIMIDYKHKVARATHHRVEKPRYLHAAKAVLNYFITDQEYREIINSKYSLFYIQNIDLRTWLITARDVIKADTTDPLLVLKSVLTAESQKKLDSYLFTDYQYNLEDLNSCIKILEIAKMEEAMLELDDELNDVVDQNEYLVIKGKILRIKKEIDKLESEGRTYGQIATYR